MAAVARPIKMSDLLRLCGRPVPQTRLRDVEAIWHLANFWKHRDEWEPNWQRQTRARETVDALRQLGIHDGCDLPILQGVEHIIGTDWWSSLTPMLQRAVRWREDALTVCGFKLPEET